MKSCGSITGIKLKIKEYNMAFMADYAYCPNIENANQYDVHTSDTIIICVITTGSEGMIWKDEQW